MALISRMKDEKWRLVVSEEEWEFPDFKTFTEIHNIIANVKDKYGKIECRRRFQNGKNT